MRQIYVCAWLLAMCTTAAACSGEKFTSEDQGSAARGDDSDMSNAPPHSNEAASGAEDVGYVTPSSGAGKSSGGAASTGGSVNTAGTSASNGGAHNLGGDSTGSTTDDDCSLGTVKLRMVPSPDMPPDYLCDAGCGTGWLTITDQKGAAAYSIFPGCGSTSCESCSALPCAAAACLPTPLTAQGSELTWSGTYLTEDTCGTYQACQRPACVPPGKYKAKACAAINGGSNDMAGGSCTPKSMQLCAEAEFELPGTSEVELVLKKP